MVTSDVSFNTEQLLSALKCEKISLSSYPDLLTSPDEYFYIKEITFYQCNEKVEILADKHTVVDSSSYEAISKALKLGVEFCSEPPCRYTFLKDEECLSLLHSEPLDGTPYLDSRVRFDIHMRDKHLLAPNQSFITITYKTNIKRKISLKLSNCRGHVLTVIPDVSVSNGEYVKSEPVNIKVYSYPVQDFFGRLKTRWKTDSLATVGIVLYLTHPHDIGIHSHDSFEILYTASGEAYMYIDTKNSGERHFTLRRGDVVIIPPECEHTVFCNDGEATFFSLKFTPEMLHLHTIPLSKARHFITLLLRHLDSLPYFSSSELTTLGLDKQMLDLFQAVINRPFAYEITTQSLLMSIFSSLLIEYCSDFPDSIAAPSTLVASLEKAVVAAKSNLYDFSAADAARASNLSYNYFCSNFKKHYGVSFSSYLDTLRVREAERMLVTTDMNITEIAMSTGFSGASHFIKKFRAIYGVTPLVFRANGRKRGKK